MKFSNTKSKLALTGLAIAGAFAVQQPMQAASYVVDDFTQFEAGQSVEGLGTVHELLNIDATYGDAVAIFPDSTKESGNWSYASNGTHANSDSNGGLNLGGFSEVSSNKNSRNNSFEFTFAEGITVSDFSLLMLDYGDYNAFSAQGHNVFLTAYSGDQQVGQDSLAGSGWEAGGDANSPDGVTEFGRTNLAVEGENITSVKLTFDFQKGDTTYNKSFDPFLGFDSLSFTASDADSADVPEPTTAIALLVIGAVGTTTLKRKKA